MKVVIPCINYSDYLSFTLPIWKRTLSPTSDITIVTHENDYETIKLAVANNVNHLPLTHEWVRDNAKFNKAAALDRAFAGTLSGQVCLTLDADIVPRGSMPIETLLEPETLYGCRRYTQEDSHSRYEPPANLPYITKNGRADSPHSCCGYFQLFRYNPSRKFGSHPTAATYDYNFAFSFPRAFTLETISVYHLGPRRLNWSGRVSPEYKPLATVLS